MDTSINPKNITIPYHFISVLLNANFDFYVNVADDIAITLLSVHFWMQGPPCPEVYTLTNENRRYKMKLNKTFSIY